MKFISTLSLVSLEIALFNDRASGFLKWAKLDKLFSPVYFFTDGKNMYGIEWDISFENGFLPFMKNQCIHGCSSEVLSQPALAFSF